MDAVRGPHRRSTGGSRAAHEFLSSRTHDGCRYSYSYDYGSRDDRSYCYSDRSHGIGYGIGFTFGHGIGYGIGFTFGHGIGYGIGFTFGHGIGYGIGFTFGHGIGYA
ncbi:hypothetical protein [Streptomyces sp. RKAG337]|uniref:hypothetical protein n=1 Tax=Streptomyces sp. RKAG337 TaxID=2893404 RepID=UPI0020349B44|nr:hypothetical protein [Streptomyces sp. RKAG337]MCM2427687.1 hypothetical protein [Streptomyces sp. RKAG337]